jgi:hypothetical protein
MPSKKSGKITFKGKIDPRLILTDAAPGYEIVDAKVTETAVEVWLSDGRVNSLRFRGIQLWKLQVQNSARHSRIGELD